MQRVVFYGVLLVVLAMFLPGVAAQEFTVDVDTVNEVVNPDNGEVPLLNISVTNTGNNVETYSISEPRGVWYNGPYPRSLTIEPGSTGHSLIYVNLPDDAVEGRKIVVVTIAAESGEEVVAQPVYRIQQDRTMLITDFSTGSGSYLPSSTVNTSVTATNVQPTRLSRNEYQAVFTLGEEQHTVPLTDLRPGEEQTVTASFNLSPFEVGVMDLDARIEDIDGDVESSKTANIRVEEMEQVETGEQREFQFVSATNTLTAENTGNVDSNGASVTASVPQYLSYFVSFDTDPSQTTTVNGETQYTWEFDSIPAGGQESVTYRVNYWVPAALLLILVTAVIMGVRLYRRPVIAKKSVKQDDTHSIHLQVVNRSGNVMDNVVVEDFVPGIASLIEKFDSSPPEKIRQGDEGTQLEWKLGRMEPGEERILTYKVSPQVQVEGYITLPAAKLSYKNGDTERSRTSHHTKADFE